METVPEQTPKTVVPHWRSSALVPWLLPPALLLFAAYMKWRQLPVLERMGTGILHHPWLSAGQIVAEAALTCWLLSGLGRAWSRRVALAAFALFTSLTAYRGIVGADSCGCFGQFAVNPWITLALDLLMMGLLFAGKPNADEGKLRRSPEPGHGGSGRVRLGLGVLAMLLVVGLTAGQLANRPALTDPGLTQAGNLMILEPDRWRGKKLPLLPYLEANDGAALEPLLAGEWRVILYSTDCDHCRTAIPKVLQAMASRSADRPRYCFVRVPASGDIQDIVPPGKYLRATLTTKYEWFASTPGVLELDNGLVQSGQEGAAAAQWIDQMVD